MIPFALLLAGASAQAPAAAKPAPQVQIKSFRTMPELRAIAFAAAPKGSTVAVSLEDNRVLILDVARGKVVKTITEHPQNVYGLAWSSDGNFLATGDESARMFVWDTRTWKKFKTYRGHQRGIQALDFNNSRSLLISTGKDDVVKVWDAVGASASALRTIPGEGANFYGARFIGKTSNFGVGILSYGAREYSASSGAVLGFFPTKQSIQDVDYTSDGTRMAAGGRDGVVTVWTPGKRKRLASLAGHDGWIFHVRFSPNGRLLASSSDDRTVRIWDTKTFQPVAVLEGQASFGAPLAWTADGKYLLSVSVAEVLQVFSVTPAQPAAPEKPPKTPKKRNMAAPS